MVLILVVLFIAFIVLCVFFTPRFKNGSDTSNNMDVIKQDESIKKQDNITQEPVQEQKQEDPPKQEETKKQNNASNNQSNKKEPQNENKSDTKIETSKDTETKKQDSVNNKTEDKVSKEEPKQEPPKEVQPPTKTAWEELGISEYDYYNKPMWNWARIDFSINDYKTYDKTREACINKGEEYYEQGYGYSCTSINSYSGNYLGEMLKTF